MSERIATCKKCNNQWSYFQSRGPTATMCKECKRERNKANVAKFLEKKRQQTVTGEPQ